MTSVFASTADGINTTTDTSDESGTTTDTSDETGSTADSIDGEGGMATADGENDSKLAFKLLNNDTYEVSCSDENKDSLKGELVIPATYNNKPVSRIDSFEGCNNITSVIIEDISFVSIRLIDIRTHKIFWISKVSGLLICDFDSIPLSFISRAIVVSPYPST